MADVTSLRDYARRKLELADIVRGALELARQVRDEDAERRARWLLEGLAADRFQLAVVGQFSRGKSTLMNAILGRAYLPMGTLPMTAVVTTVRYGSRTRVQVRTAGGTFPIETSLDDLPRYVAQSSPERERLGVVGAEIELPAEILRLGFSFVDTPGVGSAIVSNTATTQRFLPDADATILVTSAESPLTSDEMRFLARVRVEVGRVFLVINKTDLISRRDLDAVVGFVRARLQAEQAGEEVAIYPVSARDALRAKEEGDHAGLERSGLPALERTLERFLTVEKSRQLLVRTTDRARALVEGQRLEQSLRSTLASGQTLDGSRRRRADDAVEELCREEAAVARTLRDRLSSDGGPRLRAPLEAHLQRLAATFDETARQAVTDAAGRRSFGIEPTDVETEWNRLIAAPFDDWVERWSADVGRLLLKEAGSSRAELDRLRASARSAVLQALGTEADPASAEAPGSRGRDPGLHLSLTRPPLTARLPWWLSMAPSDWARSVALRRVHAGIKTAVDEVRLQAVASGHRAMVDWASAVGAAEEAETRAEAQRLLRRLRPEAGPPGLAAHDALLHRIAAFAADFEPALLPSANAGPAVSPDAPPARTSCPVCQRQVARLRSYLSEVQLELTRDEELRSEHAERGGFCPLHTWQYARWASPLGASVAYAAVAEHGAELLRSAPPLSPPPGASTDLVVERARCPVCRLLTTTEQEVISALLDRLRDQDAGEPAAVLCAPHLRVALSMRPADEVAEHLRHTLASVLQRAGEDMRTYALKRDSFRRDLITEEEEAAYLHALSLLAGDADLALPGAEEEP